MGKIDNLITPLIGKLEMCEIAEIVDRNTQKWKI